MDKKFIGLFIIVAFVGFVFYQNNIIEKTYFDYTNDKIPAVFNNFKIIHISDLHNKSFGKNQKTLLKKIKEESPDIIVITGDLIDRRRYNLEIAIAFVESAVDISPVYYVAGNHEAWSSQYDEIKNKLIALNVKVLDNEKVRVNKENDFIDIIGLKDPDFLTSNYLEGNDTLALENQLSSLSENQNFQILLSHRPELFNIYSKERIDLIFSGHAHGGQFRLPLIGGLVAPDQGFFPKYTKRAYTKEHSTLIVSRGLGNSIIPLRLFNQPEVIVLTIKNEKVKDN